MAVVGVMVSCQRKLYSQHIEIKNEIIVKKNIDYSSRVGFLLTCSTSKFNTVAMYMGR